MQRRLLVALGCLSQALCLAAFVAGAGRAGVSQAAASYCGQRQVKGAVLAHEQYCDYYYQCDEASGEPQLRACPNGLAFAGKGLGLAANCDYPHRVTCPDGTRVMGQQAVASENCAWQYGVFAHATSCTRYWQCWNGTASLQQCPFSLLYNHAIRACDWPQNVPDCQKQPICADTPNGPVPIERSCARYWLCVGGYPRLQRCPAGLAVSPSSLRCEPAAGVAGCEPPPTTPAPEAAPPRSARAGSSYTGNEPLERPQLALRA